MPGSLQTLSFADVSNQSKEKVTLTSGRRNFGYATAAAVTVVTLQSGLRNLGHAAAAAAAAAIAAAVTVDTAGAAVVAVTAVAVITAGAAVVAVTPVPAVSAVVPPFPPVLRPRSAPATLRPRFYSGAPWHQCVRCPCAECQRPLRMPVAGRREVATAT